MILCLWCLGWGLAHSLWREVNFLVLFWTKISNRMCLCSPFSRLFVLPFMLSKVSSLLRCRLNFQTNNLIFIWLHCRHSISRQHGSGLYILCFCKRRSHVFQHRVFWRGRWDTTISTSKIHYNKWILGDIGVRMLWFWLHVSTLSTCYLIVRRDCWLT